MESKILIVEIKYAPRSGNYFIDLSDESGYIVSVKISLVVAEALSRELGLKIMV